MGMMELHAPTSPFLSYVFMNVRCKERRDDWAKWCEQQQFPGTAAFQVAERFCSSVLLLHLQHPLSPIRTEAFTVRNYHGEWLPESVNHAPISTLFFLPSLLLSFSTLMHSDCSQIPGTGFPYSTSQVSHALIEVANSGLTAGHANHSEDCH